ncbi:MAG TPA: hypothetical protein VKY74_05200 [Chloroflexia bacterium]|nr:hypothetical protein [Chloroflexia bacterium]
MRALRLFRLIYAAALLLVLGVPAPGGPARPAPVQAAALPPSPFGMNLYITGQERSDAERAALIGRAQEAGVRWSREELSWANIQTGGKTEGWAGYDAHLQLLHDAGIAVIGMLLTTPAWASGHTASEPNWYWYPPRDPQAYGAFVEAAVRRWHDRVAVWELWNEPNAAGTWMPQPDPVAYAALLAAGYAGAKRADPNAVVMLGSVYVHDANNEGLAFMDQVVAASGGQLNFDIMGIHTYLTDRPPEDTLPVQPVQNIPWRLQKTREWLTRHGRGAMPIWVTEDGQSVCVACGAAGTSEAAQADRLVRRTILMLANGAAQFDYFQMKDKFNNGPTDVFGNMSVLRNDLSPRPAFYAYKTMATLLDVPAYAGPGELLHPVPNRWQPDFDRYHYRFTTPAGLVHVLWLRENLPAQPVTLHVSTPEVRILHVDGSSVEVAASSGQVPLTLTSSPIFVLEAYPAPGLDPATDPQSPTGFRVSTRFADFWRTYGGLPTFGYPITGERQEVSATDGRLYIVQWFERTRFEWHPENQPPFTVLLGLMGRQVTAGRAFPRSPAFANTGDRRYVPETGHSLSGRFLQYWQTTGGIPLYGYPISEPLAEVSPTDGKTYTVQYFERARFEAHPENRPPYDVLLGLLGRQLLR